MDLFPNLDLLKIFEYQVEALFFGLLFAMIFYSVYVWRKQVNAKWWKKAVMEEKIEKIRSESIPVESETIDNETKVEQEET